MYDTVMKDPWSVEETNLMIDGLRKYGRCVRKLAANVKTRPFYSVKNKLREMTL